jgi:hypothetical protein
MADTEASSRRHERHLYCRPEFIMPSHADRVRRHYSPIDEDAVETPDVPLVDDSPTSGRRLDAGGDKEPDPASEDPVAGS